jgi:hypothetical protein
MTPVSIRARVVSLLGLGILGAAAAPLGAQGAVLVVNPAGGAPQLSAGSELIALDAAF